MDNLAAATPPCATVGASVKQQQQQQQQQPGKPTASLYNLAAAMINM
jgi:hypothetical protein